MKILIDSIIGSIKLETIKSWYWWEGKSPTDKYDVASVTLGSVISYQGSPTNAGDYKSIFDSKNGNSKVPYC